MLRGAEHEPSRGNHEDLNSSLADDWFAMVRNVLGRAVRVLFEHGVAARLMPGENDLPFNPFAYDNSAVAPPTALRDNLAAVIHDADERFRQDGIPPDPGFYMVLPSPWLKELAIDDEGMKHYLLIGRYAAVEVLATSFRWEPFEPPGELQWFGTAKS